MHKKKREKEEKEEEEIEEEVKRFCKQRRRRFGRIFFQDNLLQESCLFTALTKYRDSGVDVGAWSGEPSRSYWFGHNL
jgi:hypothetical protein